MKKKRMLAALTAGCLAVTALLTGCGAPKKESSLNIDKAQFSETNGVQLPLTDKNVTIEVFDYADSDMNTKLFTQALSELTGITVKITSVPNSAYNDKLKMMLSSKKLPDIFTGGLTNAELEMLAKNGAVAAIEDYADNLPNMKKYLLENKAFTDNYSYGKVDGKSYVMPGYNTQRKVNHGYMYRKDIFEKNGIKPWTNTEEFYQALKKLKEIYPDSSPFVSKLQVKTVDRFIQSWGFPGSAVYNITKREGEDEWVYPGTDPAVRECLDFMQKLYSEGLLDQEFLTCTEASWATKMTQEGKGFVTFDWVDRMDLFYDQVKDSNPDFNLTFGYPIGQGKYANLGEVGSTCIMVAKNDKTELAMKLIDFLYSPAGAKLATLGVEGISYTLDGDKVKYNLPEDKTLNITNLQEEYGLFNATLSASYDDKCAFFNYTPHVQEAQELVVNENLLKERTDSVSIMVASKNSERFNELLNELGTQFEVLASKYITASAGELDGLWNSWLEQANQIGLGELMQIVAEQ